MSSSRMPATWFMTEALFLITLSLICALAFAQNTGDGARGSTPPGSSQDGSRPADGAIKGGSSIAPGETAGMPKRTPTESAEAQKRCDQLSGSLRDQCLEKDRNDAATGGSAKDVLKKP
jgi:hypothetical protein